MESQAKSRWLTPERCEREAEAVRSCTSDWERPSLSLSASLAVMDRFFAHSAAFLSLLTSQAVHSSGLRQVGMLALLQDHTSLPASQLDTRNSGAKLQLKRNKNISFRDVRISFNNSLVSNIYLSYQNEKIKGNWRLSHSCTSFKPIFFMSRTKGQNVLTNEYAGFLQHWPITVRLVPSLIRWVYDRVM